MFKKFFVRHKYLLLLSVVLLAGCVFFMGQSWLNGMYFIGGGDVKTQWFPFYMLCRKAIVTGLKEHIFPFYSWVLFLGNNIH